MPDSLIGHIKSMLALKLTPEFEMEPSPVLAVEAERGRQFLAAYYLRMESAAVDGGLLNLPSQRRFW